MARSIFGIGSAISAATAAASAAAAAKKKNNSSSSSSSSTSKPTSSSTSNGTASSANSTASSATSTPDWLKTAQANSQAWHSADAATRKNLEAQNQKLYSDHGYTYDSKTGKWSAPTSSSTSSGLVSGAMGAAGNTIAAGLNALKNAQASSDHSRIPSGNYANTDLGNTFWQAATSGSTDVDYLQSIADERVKKAQANSGLNQFANDQNQAAMQAYINQLKRTQEYADQYNKYYDDARAAQQEAYTQAAEQAAQQYRQLMPTMNQSYDDAARQAYINYRVAQRDLPEQLAAAGISGQGAAESSLVQQNNAYNQAYNQNEQARAQALANLENQAANAYNTTANQGLQSVADLMAQQAQAQQNILAQQEQMRQNAIGNLYNYNNAMGTMGGMPTLDAQQTLANIAYNKQQLAQNQSQFEQNLAYEKTNADRDYWLQRWQAQGTRGADAQIAAILGIPVGSVYAPGSYNPNYY